MVVLPGAACCVRTRKWQWTLKRDVDSLFFDSVFQDPESVSKVLWLDEIQQAIDEANVHKNRVKQCKPSPSSSCQACLAFMWVCARSHSVWISGKIWILISFRSQLHLQTNSSLASFQPSGAVSSKIWQRCQTKTQIARMFHRLWKCMFKSDPFSPCWSFGSYFFSISVWPLFLCSPLLAVIFHRNRTKSCAERRQGVENARSDLQTGVSS